MTKILNAKQFISEKLDIQPVSKDRLEDMTKKSKELANVKNDRESYEFAEYIWDSYFQIQKEIMNGNYKINVSDSGIEISGFIHNYGMQKWYVELYANPYDNHRLSMDCDPAPYIDGEEIWLNNTLNDYSDDAFDNVAEKYDFNFKTMALLFANNINFEFNDDIIDAIDEYFEDEDNEINEKLNIQPVSKKRLNDVKNMLKFYLYKGNCGSKHDVLAGDYIVSEKPLPQYEDNEMYKDKRIGVYVSQEALKRKLRTIASYEDVVFSAKLKDYALWFFNKKSPFELFKKNFLFGIDDNGNIFKIYKVKDYNKYIKEQNDKDTQF